MDKDKSNYKLTDQEYKSFREAFELFDNDKNGYIDKAELSRMCHSLGEFPTDDQLDCMIEKADTLNKDGKIEFSEFVNFMKTHGTCQTRSKQDDVRAAFKVFDKDGNGLIDRDELRTAMLNLGEKLTEEELDMMIYEADSNGDGKISFEEFAKMFNPATASLKKHTESSNRKNPSSNSNNK